MKKTPKHLLTCMMIVIMALAAIPALNLIGLDTGVTASAASTQFEYDFCDEEKTIINIIGYKGSKSVNKLDIPAEIDGRKVYSIGCGAFEGY
ncbi:MAG: hypothetical protein NC110_07630, partial [Ruminococcus sp.]|nr:hypothetical protein [Ruminococcus sp.]